MSAYTVSLLPVLTKHDDGMTWSQVHLFIPHWLNTYFYKQEIVNFDGSARDSTSTESNINTASSEHGGGSQSSDTMATDAKPIAFRRQVNVG
jgi:hypothetical protein